ncbi:MAG: ABC transporter substrate-binding protein [Oscillospiraceae bacterium]|nr:ABC transporter substrate-binding protein [Oscillospiraceae bacterium]
MRRALCILLAALGLLLCACTAKENAAPASPATERMELAYAERFTVDLFPDGGALVTLGEKERFLLLDADAAVPAGYEAVPVIRTPVERVYVASSSVPDLFVQLGALDRVRFTSTKRESWRLDEVRGALDAGTLLYAGKYSAPDYELLLEEGCDLAVENTMILHEPETREKLEALGLPVLLEYSSYEPHPLGRVEWIKLYGLLTGRRAEAEAFFDEQRALFDEIETLTPTGRTAAFFHITANGSVTVRRQADYVTRMLELAGGESVFTDLPEDDSALSTVTIQMESFYAQARDADVLIYNSTASVDVQTIEELLTLCPQLKDFKAVCEGRVWCTEHDMFQRSSAAAEVIADFHEILQDAPREEDLTYLHKIVQEAS